jgi:predicted nucleic acid-binding protein
MNDKIIELMDLLENLIFWIKGFKIDRQVIQEILKEICEKFD